MYRQMIVLLIVLSGHVLRSIIVDPFRRIENSPRPSRKQCFLNVVNFRLVLLFHRIVSIDPLLYNFVDSRRLSRDFFNTNGNRSRCLSYPLPSDVFLLLCQSCFTRHSEAILSHTQTRLCHPNLCFHLVWSLGIAGINNHIPYLWIFAIMSYCSMQRRISMSSISNLILYRMSSPWLSIYWRQIFLTKRQLQILVVLAQYPGILSSLLLLDLNRRLMSFVS